jgi:hypothetical protein
VARRHLRGQEGHQAEAVVCFAGPVAEARYRGLGADAMAPWWSGPWRLDLENLLTHDDVGMLAPLRERAEDLVARHWAAIERVASFLLARGEVSGGEVEMAAASGRDVATWMRGQRD